jgi:hypothetical protein
VKKVLSLIVAVTFAAGMTGSAAAQAQSAPAAPKAEDKKVEKAPAAEKKPMARSASGSVKSASADNLVVAGKDKGKAAEWTFPVDAKTKIMKAGKTITTGDIKPGDSVMVRYTEDGGKMMVQSVNVRGAAPAKRTEAKKEEKPAEKK